MDLVTNNREAFVKTIEASYIYFKLDKKFKKIEERLVPKELVKYSIIPIAMKAIVEQRFEHTWNF